ncbi:MAG: type II secretion system F family protein [Candidatus Algichlamydia australiensis]|nr:type II secretion system F family protein [Chlamydiales bacterium]
MSLYQYTALASSGKKIKGIIDADSLGSAKERLLKQKILVTKLSQYERVQKKSHHLKPAQLLDFTRDMCGLLRAGLPLYESLATVEEKYRGQKCHGVLLDLADQVKQGSSLSTAMEKYKKSFSSLYVSMVAAAEESGAIENVFEELSSFLTRQQKLKKQIGSAMFYPAFLGSFCLLVLSALLFFLIPSLEQLFEDRQLHPLTAFILGLSHFLRAYKLILGTLLATAVVSICLLMKRPENKRSLQSFLLRTPVVSTIITEAVLIRFCRAMASLLTNGVSMVKALRLSRKVMGHPLFEELIEEAEGKMVEGKKISESLGSSKLMPPLVARMLAIAEETGSSAAALGNIAAIYEENLERNLARFTALLQPVMMLFLGLIVGLIVLAVLLPLTDMQSFM